MDGSAWPATFATERLSVRPVGPGDRAFHARLYADREVMAHVGPTLGEAEAGHLLDRFIQAWRSTAALARLWVVQHTARGERLGLMSVRSSGDEATAELGLLFLTTSQGGGYASEAVTGLLSQIAPLGGALSVRNRSTNGRMDALMNRLCFVPDGVSDGLHRWRSP